MPKVYIQSGVGRTLLSAEFDFRSSLNRWRLGSGCCASVVIKGIGVKGRSKDESKGKGKSKGKSKDKIKIKIKIKDKDTKSKSKSNQSQRRRTGVSAPHRDHFLPAGGQAGGQTLRQVGGQDAVLSLLQIVGDAAEGNDAGV